MKRAPILLIVFTLAFAIALRFSNQVQHASLRALTVLETLVTAPGDREPVSINDDPIIPFYIHRGRSNADHFDNSEMALAHTAELYRRVEIDVAFSSDGVPYLSHDDDLSARAAKLMNTVSGYDSSQLDKVVLKDGTKLLRLKDFIENFSGRFESIIMDIKTSNESADEKAWTLSDLLGKTDEQKVMVISLAGIFLMSLKKLRPKINVGCECYLSFSNWLAGFNVASINSTYLTRSRDRLARLFQLRRLYWTAYNEADLETILRWRPSYVIVNLGGPTAPSVPREWQKQ